MSNPQTTRLVLTTAFLWALHSSPGMAQTIGVMIDGHYCPNVGSMEQIKESLKDPICTSFLYNGPNGQGAGCYPDGIIRVECSTLTTRQEQQP